MARREHVVRALLRLDIVEARQDQVLAANVRLVRCSYGMSRTS